ncbi:MAG: hypothetical protein KA998_02230 [Rickettsiaceae bacterium]|nr:hypothetical protein [Rickettsiaceae bacterium]
MMADVDGWSVSYSKISIAGFPSKWIFEVADPSFVSSDESISLKNPMLTLKVGVRMKDFDISIGRESEVKIATEEEEAKTYYAIFEENPHFAVGIKSLISRNVNSLENLAYIRLLPFKMSLRNEDSEVVALLNNSSYIENLGNLSFKLSLDASYEGAESLLLFSKLTLNILADTAFKEDNKKIFLTHLKAEKFDLLVNDEAQMNISGSMNFFPKDKFPEGEFVVDIKDYPKLVDLIWWDAFDLSVADVKNIIEKASGNNESNNARLPISFVREGLKIGAELFSNLTGE